MLPVTIHESSVTSKVAAPASSTDTGTSVREVARAVGVSQSTALRALRDLVETKTVVRTGFARATRYALREGV